MFLPVWNNFAKNHNKNCVSIESSQVNNFANPGIKTRLNKMLKKQPYVPNIAKYSSKTKRMYYFNKDRTLNSLLNFFPKTI